jgi:hypothetical protein
VVLRYDKCSQELLHCMNLLCNVLLEKMSISVLLFYSAVWVNSP